MRQHNFSNLVDRRLRLFCNQRIRLHLQFLHLFVDLFEGGHCELLKWIWPHYAMSFESVKALIGSSRYADATNDDGWTGEGPSRFESICHRMCTPDNAGSMRDKALFFAKQ